MVASTQNTAATGLLTKYTYDVLGDLLNVTQNAQSSPQQTRTYNYDGLGRLLTENNPETNQVAYSYTYDTDASCGTSNGDLVKRVDPIGNKTCYAYDALHRLKQVSYPTIVSPTVSTPTKYFVYDSASVNGQSMANAKGRLARACTGGDGDGNCGGTLTTDLGFGYSVRGEVTDAYESSPNSGGYYHTTASYWANGLLNQLTGPGMPTFTYSADGEGRVSTVTASSGQNPVPSAVSYNLFGEPTAIPLGSGTGDQDTYQYDANTGRMTQYKFTVNGTSDTGSLTWNANGTLQSLVISDGFHSANNQTCSYGYDDLARLASANCGTIWNETFTLDSFGNIKKNGISGAQSFQPSYVFSDGSTNNRIYGLSGTQPTYDANGNLLDDTYNDYTWDAEGRMATKYNFVLGGTTRAVTYDALGRWVEESGGSSDVQEAYDPTGAKLSLMLGQTLAEAKVPLPGGANAAYGSTGLYDYRHADWEGSVRLQSTPSRALDVDSNYAAYGETYAAYPASGFEAFYAGYYQEIGDPDMYDTAAREYHPTQGRWISPDPAGLGAADLTNPQSLNRYAYVMNNPLGAIDPAGLDCIDIGGGVMADDQQGTTCANITGNTPQTVNVFGGPPQEGGTGCISCAIGGDWAQLDCGAALGGACQQPQPSSPSAGGGGGGGSSGAAQQAKAKPSGWGGCSIGRGC